VISVNFFETKHKTNNKSGLYINIKRNDILFKHFYCDKIENERKTANLLRVTASVTVGCGGLVRGGRILIGEGVEYMRR
jgi:hypothetical protein